MISKIFKECQRFTQIWIWCVVIGILFLNIFGIIQQIIFEKPFGNNPAPDNMLFALFIIPISLFLLLLILRLDTKIDHEGIHYKYFPFHGKTRNIPFEKIEKAYVRKYKPIREFGGWGLRIGLKKGSGKALNVKGNQGIPIELKNGKKILLGTQKPEEATNALKEFFKQNIE